MKETMYQKSKSKNLSISGDKNDLVLHKESSHMISKPLIAPKPIKLEPAAPYKEAEETLNGLDYTLGNKENKGQSRILEKM